MRGDPEGGREVVLEEEGAMITSFLCRILCGDMSKYCHSDCGSMSHEVDCSRCSRLEVAFAVRPGSLYSSYLRNRKVVPLTVAHTPRFRP